MATDEELRRQAIKSIKKKRDFWAHAVAYCIVNIFLIIVWYLTGHGYFWPVWVMGAWGSGLAFNAWDAYGRSGNAISETEIQKEIERRQRG
jgi:2TM domain